MTEKTQIDFLWKKISEKAQKLIPQMTYSAYVEPIVPVDIVSRKIVLRTVSEMGADILMKKYADQLKEAVVQSGAGLNGFMFVVEGSEVYTLEAAQAEDDHFEPLPIDKRFTFDSFVPGPSNKFVFAAAKAVAENPGVAFNPLFIYGSTGLGKTHLMHAIANEIREKKPSLKVLYTTCEKFLNEVIDNMVTKNGGRDKDALFRAHYRNADVLLVDDIQFISKKIAVQEAFFHTFNELFAQNKQIIISSDRSPKEIAALEDRLRTRFEGGLTADIQPPDLETKIAILKRKALEKKCVLPEEVLEFLAKDSGTDVRTLEGRLTKLLFASKLHEEPISLKLARLALNESVPEESETVTPEAIIKSVCSYYKVTKTELLGKHKKQEVVRARQICAYLMCEMLSLPLVNVGKLLSRDHATIIHSRNKIGEYIKVNDRIAKDVDDIKNIVLKQ
ncbi:MAG: chromosomal replication initiator protein DnaA [Clostridia bacterium]|nr:chromosomal replication initiator protein DnaA [Clostridia bacterium]MBR7099998.1 chromosomal replication initiator protein DnaA [Clostridia bacterium]